MGWMEDSQELFRRQEASAICFEAKAGTKTAHLSWKRFEVANCRFVFPSRCARLLPSTREKSSSSSCAYLHNLINQFFLVFSPRISFFFPRYTLLHFMYRMLRWKMLKSLKQQQMYRNPTSNSLRRSMKTVQLVAVTIPSNRRLTVIFLSSMHHPFRWVRLAFVPAMLALAQVR